MVVVVELNIDWKSFDYWWKEGKWENSRFEVLVETGWRINLLKTESFKGGIVLYLLYGDSRWEFLMCQMENEDIDFSL